MTLSETMDHTPTLHPTPNTKTIEQSPPCTPPRQQVGMSEEQVRELLKAPKRITSSANMDQAPKHSTARRRLF